ncbi:MAG: hypothetical protein RL328_2155 [Acidobacteriota bacterium]
MKQTLVVLMAAAMAVSAFGQNGPLKQREKNQKARIKEGVKDGSITRREAKELKQDQKEIRQDVKDARADGVVTGKEAAKITREQNKASRDIYKQKNDKQNQK